MNADALLAAIRESPDDDAPRLIYADWLEEHGDEKDRAHAELIRAQVEMARLPLDDDRRAELLHREDKLRHRHAFMERLGFKPWVDHQYVAASRSDWDIGLSGNKRMGRTSRSWPR
jgi:uncharacterized protein (TIGR02996 family)